MRAVGIILAGGNQERMQELSKKRAVAAMPFAGSYRSIDFALSNMSNSRINRVAVMTQYNARSLNEHLNSAKWWDFGRKQGGLYVLAPTITAQNSSWYRGTADCIYQNLDWLRECHEPYVVIASGDGIYKLDYNKVLEYHIGKNADMTVVCKEMPEQSDFRRFGVVTMDADGRITDMEEKPETFVNGGKMVSCGIYVIRRRLLIELIEKSAQEGQYNFVTDILIRYKNVKKIYGYRLESYWNSITSVESYYEANMDFLKPEVRKHFFADHPQICSKVHDLPPAKYNPGSEVGNALVGSGSIVNGTVRDSLLFKKVFVGNHCVVKNSIIMNDVYLGDNTYLENCIVDSHTTIRAGSVYKGEGKIKVVAESGEYVYHCRVGQSNETI